MASYEDIIGLTHPEPKNHCRMAREKRAAQFMPFAALGGYAEAMEEESRITEEKKELGQDALEQLDRTLATLKAGMRVRVSCFVPDAKKQGGKTLTVCGEYRSVDGIKRVLRLGNGSSIPLDAITELTMEEKE